LQKQPSTQQNQAPILKTHPVSYRAVTDISMQSKHDVMHHRRSVLTGLARLTVGGACAAVSLPAWAQAVNSTASIRVAAASDLKFALAQLGAQFERETGAGLADGFVSLCG
jgi:hypothetical protein